MLENNGDKRRELNKTEGRTEGLKFEKKLTETQA